MKKQNSTFNAEDKALEAFADVLIQHLEIVEMDNWQKPWAFAGGKAMWPRNIDGREYAASNAVILMMHTNLNGYTAPIYATFDRIAKLNYTEGDKPERLRDAEGNELPFVKVNKGASHMPVIKTLFSVIHKQTKERIPYQDFMELDDEARKDYNVFPRSFVYRVFNIDQTNLREARPELYKKLVGEADKPVEETAANSDELHVPAIDMMVKRNLWQCEIDVRYSNSAYYSLRDDKVSIPEKKQFKMPEGFYGTLLHECAHSTGAPKRYNRNMGHLDSKIYAREELLAELTAALVASRYGLTKYIKSDSLPYLKSWLEQLKAEPKFIKELLNDVKKASSQIIRRLDVIQQRIEELTGMGVEDIENHPDFLEVHPKTKQPIADPAKYVVKEKEEVVA